LLNFYAISDKLFGLIFMQISDKLFYLIFYANFPSLSATYGIRAGGIFRSEGEGWHQLRAFFHLATKDMGRLERDFRHQLDATILGLRDRVWQVRRAAADKNCSSGSGFGTGTGTMLLNGGVVDLRGPVELLIGSSIHRLLFGHDFEDVSEWDLMSGGPHFSNY
jgi:hypothetical protein